MTVNFWGFDGKRSRGALVVNKDVASATARAFSRLYDQQFRIRQMRPMDSTWGKNPKGPGANDYAAMDADNTSAFNCRYVGGEEASKQYSNHAYGTRDRRQRLREPVHRGRRHDLPGRVLRPPSLDRARRLLVQLERRGARVHRARA